MTFDFVYCSHVLEHCFNPLCAVDQMLRVLKPNGYLYIVVPIWLGSEKNSYRKPVWDKVDLIDFDGPDDVKSLIPVAIGSIVWERTFPVGVDGAIDDEYRLLVVRKPGEWHRHS